MDPRAELERITDEIMTLGSQIETKRKRALEIAVGMVATERNGQQFRVEATRVVGGSWRLFLDGPKLKADGSNHARARISSPIALLRALGQITRED